MIEKIPPGLIRDLILNFNPLAGVLVQIRHAVIDPNAPSTAEVMGGRIHLLVPISVVLATFALGWVVFARQAPRIAEDL
jgi:ABC-2 type transport system permease protein